MIPLRDLNPSRTTPVLTWSLIAINVVVFLFELGQGAGGMHELIERAGILVLVSHDLGLMRTLCTRLIWMSGGQMVLDGDPNEVAEVYLRSMKAA